MYVLLESEDFERLDISSQDDGNLCKQSGEFEDNSFRYVSEKISDTQFIIEYEKIDTNEKVFTISDKSVVDGITEFTSYKFYKNV